MHFHGINHVSLRVTNLARASQFYTHVLSLKPHPEKPNWLGVGQGCLVHLMEPTTAGSDSPPEPSRHFALEVSCLEDVVALLLRHGLKPYQSDVTQHHHREIKSDQDSLDFGIGTVFVVDPDGNVIEFMQKGRGIFAEFDPA
jgi:catechol 2,3-dioxygenase-like lactoylglutathione lyase family enzyme